MITIISCIVGLITSVFAQPVINYSSTHSIGTQSTWYYIGGVTTALAQSGANATWDLSANGCTPMGTFNAVDPSTTPYASSYTAANLAYELTQTGIGVSYVYFIDSPTERSTMAEGVGSTTPVVYSTYAKDLQYPFIYTNSFASTTQTTTGSPVAYTCTYDAYGTLTINSKTYNDIVRVSTNTGEVTFYVASPVVFPIIFKTGGYFFYNEPTTFTGIENITTNSQITVYPNPASDVVTLNIDNVNNADLTLNFYNEIGTLVKSEILKQNNRQINIGDLSNGIYMVEIKSKEWTKKQKLIIQR